MFKSTCTAMAMRKVRFSVLVAALTSFGLVAGTVVTPVAAAPSYAATVPAVFAQNVDWLSAEEAAKLDIGMDVQVPSWVPEPFSGTSPSVSASAGYYQLYWIISGGPPTFLYVEGVAGGSLPAGSLADLNKELSINASVQGWDAIHDIGIPAGSSTPIYDQVWWVANGVRYTVSSNNMTGTDSLSLAQSMVTLEVPALVEVPTEPVIVPTDPPSVDAPATDPVIPTNPPAVAVSVQDPVVVSTEPPVVDVPASNPVVEEASIEESVVDQPEALEDEVSARELVTEDEGSVDSPEVIATQESSTSIVNEETSPVTEVIDTVPGESEPLDSGATQSTATGGPWSPNPFDANTPSDGTSGPVPPVIGGDGTGGLYDNSLPLVQPGSVRIP